MNLGGLGVFLASILEEIIVPIPSTLVQSGAGLFLLEGKTLSFLSILKLITSVALPSALGVVIGSLFVYFIAFYGGSYALQRYGKYFFINYEKLEKARNSIISKPKILVFITILRFIPLFPNSFVTACCGLLKINLKQYLLTTFIGIFIRALYLGAIGWLAGGVTENVLGIDNFFSKIGILILALFGISVITGILVSYFYKRQK